MNPEQLHILQHSLGCNQYGHSEHRGPDEGDGCFGYYRNRFVSDMTPDLMTLVQLGYMRDYGPLKICGGAHCFSVTVGGIAAMREHSPKPPKLTRSQRRYRYWRKVADAFGDMTFGEWLKTDHAKGAR
jgi:hypothetical protein